VGGEKPRPQTTLVTSSGDGHDASAAAPHDESDLAGTSLLQFRVLERLGAGGMGVVYKAIDDKLGRTVALKVLAGRYLVDDRNKALIFREARSAAAVHHPNIATIFDVHDTAQATFLAMELVAGESLRARLQRGPLAEEEAMAIASKIADGLAHAHAAGVVHRDLKPENIMLTSPPATVKLLDFGIAKFVTPAAHAKLAPQERALAPTLRAPLETAERGRIVGTPAYMAPEQARGDAVDARTDVFAFGVLFYEMLAGRTPFPERRDAPPFSSDATANPWTPVARLSEAAPRTSREIERLVERCLAVSPEARPPDGAALQSALAACRLRMARAQRRRRIATTVAIVACAALALAAGGKAWSVRHGVAPPSVSAPPRCTSPLDCAAHVGRPWCRASDGACVALASEDCRTLAEPGDLANPRTVWLGVMLPLEGEDAAVFGASNLQAIDLARKDFVNIMSGITSDVNAVAPPIGVVACDDSAAPQRAARHLVDDLDVPAVIGFRTSAEAVEIGSSLLVPHHVLTMAALNTSPLVTKIPQPSGDPRLVWRTTYSTEESTRAVAAVIESLFEPTFRALPQAVSPSRPLRVAVLRPANTAGGGFANALFARLRFNGKSALDNGNNYREITVDEGAAEPSFAAAVEQLSSFAPHVIVYNGRGALVRSVFLPLDARWRESAYRPRIISGTGWENNVFSAIGNNDSLRRRMFATTTASSTVPNARFVVHYNQSHRDSVTRTVAPNSSYDAFYVLAYATYAAAMAGQTITGPSMALAMRRLLPPGRPIDVGPEGIFDAFTALRAGGSIDLNGATSKLDFDPSTGEAPVDHVVLCVGADGTGNATEGIESGLVYDAALEKLVGRLSCERAPGK
jgi:ABC-type branched-subunit amino acid transport system substrate-binding protein